MSELSIIFEDNHLMLFNKPAGLLTQPTHLENESVETLGKDWIKKVKDRPGNVFLHPVHRLDRPASGIVLCARTSKALSRLSHQMRERTCKKTYLACIDHTMPALAGSLEHYLIHDHHRALVLEQEAGGAKWSRLEYRLINQKGGISLLEISLITGRYHQIRAQLSHIGCPIIGDSKYGSSQSLGNNCIALHHFRLEFTHPVQQTALSFEAPLPDHWPLKARE